MTQANLKAKTIPCKAYAEFERNLYENTLNYVIGSKNPALCLLDTERGPSLIGTSLMVQFAKRHMEEIREIMKTEGLGLCDPNPQVSKQHLPFKEDISRENILSAVAATVDVPLLPFPLDIMNTPELHKWLIPQMKADLAETKNIVATKIWWPSGDETLAHVSRPSFWDRIEEKVPWVLVSNPIHNQNNLAEFPRRPDGSRWIEDNCALMRAAVEARLQSRGLDPATHIGNGSLISIIYNTVKSLRSKF